MSRFWLSVLLPLGTHGASVVHVLRIEAPGLTLQWVRDHANGIAQERFPGFYALWISSSDPASAPPADDEPGDYRARILAASTRAELDTLARGCTAWGASICQTMTKPRPT